MSWSLIRTISREQKQHSPIPYSLFIAIWSFRWCFRVHSEDDELPIDEQPIARYLAPRRLADLCFNDDVLEMDEEEKGILMENQSVIRSVFIENDIDSFNVQRINEHEIGIFMRNQTGNDEIYDPAKNMLYALKEKVKSMECHSVNWKHIVNAVDHEMTHRIAQIIDSLSSDFGDLKVEWGGAWESADKLINTINSKVAMK